MAGPISSRLYQWAEVPWAEGRVLTRGTVDGLPALTWGRADRNQLATVRQLRELGLRPGGAEPVAVLVFGHTQPHRRQVEHAGLYRIADAVPKRTATPKQRAAIAKALAARRTCQRCGEEQDYYVSTTSRQCGPCEDAIGFWDDDRPDVDAVGGSSPPAVADIAAVEVPEQLSKATREAVAAEGNDGAARAVRDTRPAVGRSGAAGASSGVETPPAQRSDGLAERARAADAVPGDASARSARLAELYDKYWPYTVRFIARRVRRADRDMAKDLAQQTFLRAWPYLDRAPIHTDDRMRPWLATIARHTVARHYRHRSAQKRAAETLVAPDALVWGSARVTPAGGATPAGDEAATVQQRMILAAALEQLPPDTRQILRLRFLEDRPVNEVAAQLGKARATIVRHTAAGLAALREQLTEQLDEHATDDETGRAQHRSLGTPRRGPLGLSLSEYVRSLDPPAAAGQVEADPALAGMSLRDYGAARLPSAMRGLSAGTAYPYLAGWRQRIVPTLGDLPVREIDATAVDAAMQSWASEQCSLSTVTNTRSVLRRVLDQAVRDGVLDHNPARELTPAAAQAVETTAPTGTEAPAPSEALADAADLDKAADLADDAPLTERGTADLGEWDQISRPEQLAELRWPEQQAAAVTAEQDLPAPDPLGLGAAGTAQPSNVRQPATPAHGVISVLTRPEPGLPTLRYRSSSGADSAPGQVPTRPYPGSTPLIPPLPTTSPPPTARPPTTRTPQDAENAEDAVSWAGRQQQPSIAETAAAVTRARQALARIAQARAAQTQATANQARAEQLARWHADDHTTDQADQAGGRHRELEGITR